MNRCDLPIEDSHVLGLNEQWICHWQDTVNAALHIAVVDPFLQLQSAAKEAGIALQIASGYRSFHRQLTIWNNKAKGVTPVYDDHHCRISITPAQPLAAVEAICRWSAIPGASRHHWGSDFDVYDKHALGDDTLQLTSEEATTQFKQLHQFLDDYLPTSDFYRPYAKDDGGVGVELWHLSYRPVASQYLAHRNKQSLIDLLCGSDMLFKETVVAHIDEIYQRFIVNGEPLEPADTNNQKSNDENL